MKKGEVIEQLTLDSISSDGRAVGRIEGRVVFVKGAVPGDVAKVKITGKEKRFLVGYAEEILTPSENRIEPVCQHFGTCGGCKWQSLSYEAQLEQKASHVRSNLEKISGMDLPELEPILGSDETYFYRNKLEFTFSNNRWLTREEIESGGTFEKNALGFHVPRMFDKILEIDTCHLQEDPSNEIRNKLKEFALREKLTFYDIRNHHGLLRNVIIRTTRLGETMILMQFGENNKEGINTVMQFLVDSFPNVTSFMYIVNTKKNDSYQDLPVHPFFGEDFIKEKLGGLTYRIGPKSFFQTNSKQAEKLYEKVRELANIQSGEVIYDLYTGTGTIANYMADTAEKVIGIEYVEDAVVDARMNAQENGITNTEFHAGDMKDILSDDFIARNGKPDVIITDPPRAGMHKDVVEVILSAQPNRIVYVSCNPATQARDLELMKDSYEVQVIQPVDMFPQTSHVECVALLKLRK